MAPRNRGEELLAGGVAGIVSRTAIAPIERVKILVQTGAGRSSAGYTGLVREMYHNEGLLAFWRGNTAGVVRVVPYMSATFLCYEEYKAALLGCGAHKQQAALAAGSLAGVTAVCLTYPLDLVRAAMAKPSSVYTSMFHALRSISAERGVGALYSGISATVLGVAPYAGLKFASYEALKGVVGASLGLDESQLRPWQRVSAGALAGLLAQTAVYPLDVVRRRMQMHDGKTALYS